MKFTLALLSAITLAAAQNLSGEPACATPCLASAIVAAGCGLSDYACQCASSGIAAIGGLAAPCLIASCDATLLPTIQSIGLALCSEYSAGLTASVSGTGSIVTTQAPSSTASVAPSTTAGAATVSTTAAVTSGNVTTKASATTASASAAASSASKAGAAGIIANGIGGLAAALVGAAALL